MKRILVGTGIVISAAVAPMLVTSPGHVQKQVPFLARLVTTAELCLDIRGASKANGGDAIIWDCHDGRNQQWILHQLETDEWGNRWMAIKNAHSGKCLDVEGASVANGANVIQWDCHFGDNQHWAFDGNRLVSRASGLCLDIHRHDQYPGADVRQWGCHHGANQHWAVADAPEP